MRRKKHYEKRVVKSGKEEQEKPEREEKGEHRGTEARRKE